MKKKPTVKPRSIYTYLLIAVCLMALAFALLSLPGIHKYGNLLENRFTNATSTLYTTDNANSENATSTEGSPFIAINESCGPSYGGTCVNMRSGPGIEHPSLLKLRSGLVLRVAETVTNEIGESWYRIDPGPNIRHKERITGEWYVSAAAAELFYYKGDTNKRPAEVATTTKIIMVSVSKQMLYAFEDANLFMEQSISTGLDLTPTQRGAYEIFWKTPSRYMQGPIEGQTDDYYDLPGVPWNLYFTTDGAAIHGAYWHNNFGRQWSHGCVNLPPSVARELYEWADIGTAVIVSE